MRRNLLLTAALLLSWLLSATLGGLLALRFGKLGVLPTPTIRTRGIEIVDDAGAVRLKMGLEHAEPSIRFLSANDLTLLRIAINPVTPLVPSKEAPYLIPAIELNDGAGDPTIRVEADRNQRGVLAFYLAALPERMALGYFGITDDGTDTGTWGLQVLDGLNGQHTGHIMGVATHNGRDTNLVWPMYPLPDKVK